MSEQIETLARGIGRRKEAIAQVQLLPGTGLFFINGVPAITYFQQNPRSIFAINAPIKLYKEKQASLLLEEKTSTSTEEKSLEKSEGFDTIVTVRGGGLVGQADAIQLGVARALCQVTENSRKSFKKLGYLTQDSRVKERRKYGLKKARKASQYHKR
uniref:Small ribosomal subunit protein uS9c n=1 Tax=Floydiella terrestris TaxID=51328 RepID=E2DSI0_FLOTE|nr:ribosomal protein S9 [Floydiella terrestris]ACZ58467.1 ribosomal protein S9 [Floydiella terrestris]